MLSLHVKFYVGRSNLSSSSAYIFIFFFLCRCDPTRVMASSFLRFLDHTQQRTTVGRTPLDEWQARRRDLYLTTHNTHNKHPCSGVIRTHDLSRRAAADLRLRPRGHRDRLYFTENIATGMWYTHTKGNMGTLWDQSGHSGGAYRPQPSFAILQSTQPVPPARSHVTDDLALQHVVLLLCYVGNKRCWY